MSGAEKRNEIRISADRLPEEYHSFSILLPHGMEVIVHTSDASLNGFGFYSELDQNEFIVGCRLVLYPLGNEHPVYGIIVHSSATNKGTRVGVQLQKLGGYKNYTTAIQEIIAKPADSKHIH